MLYGDPCEDRRAAAALARMSAHVNIVVNATVNLSTANYFDDLRKYRPTSMPTSTQIHVERRRHSGPQARTTPPAPGEPTGAHVGHLWAAVEAGTMVGITELAATVFSDSIAVAHPATASGR